MSARLHPLVLCGGSGSRLWPMSRRGLPKQFLALASERSMLEDTLARVGGEGFAPPLVVTGEGHRFLVAEDVRRWGRPARVVVEPVGRNTAPAVAVGALLAAEADPDALLLVLPADHVIRDVQAFHGAIARGAVAARGGALVTFGIAPTAPATGYGYIRRGGALEGAEGCEVVERFVEKPDRETAEGFLAEGRYAWNGGIFLFRASAFLAELERLRPDVLAACQASLAGGSRDADFVRLHAEAFAACPSVSVDYAVMEHTPRAAVVPVEMRWSDVGAWSALWELGQGDEDNVTHGDVLLHDTRGSYVRSEGPLVAAVGLDDAVVVATADAVLVTTRAASQHVKAVVEQLEALGRDEASWHRTVRRPWGSFTNVHTDAGFQIKRLVVKPGARLSLQKHHHRREHWVVVRGRALVTRGDEQLELGPDDVTFIEQEMVHRLENVGAEELVLVEVQVGDYLGEDDIVRLADSYGRA